MRKERISFSITNKRLNIDMLYQDPLSRALLGEDGGGSVGLTTSLFDI